LLLLAGEDGLVAVMRGDPGACVSTMKLLDAPLVSTLPSKSVARTWKVWEPSARFE
jgi:hypothetical protein